MTTIQTERVDYSQGPARIDTQSSSYAQFPAASQLPKAAADAIEPFLTLRARRADATSAYGEAIAALEKAKLADAAALLDHVRAGGTASEFRDTATAAAKDVAYAGADIEALDKLIAKQFLDTAITLQRMADKGAAQAQVEKAARHYSEAIAALATARQDYINACGVQLFWRYLTEKGICIVPGGDEIHLRRGPVTKIDRTTLQCLELDAQTHERLATADL